MKTTPRNKIEYTIITTKTMYMPEQSLFLFSVQNGYSSVSDTDSDQDSLFSLQELRYEKCVDKSNHQDELVIQYM